MFGWLTVPFLVAGTAMVAIVPGRLLGSRAATSSSRWSRRRSAPSNWWRPRTGIRAGARTRRCAGCSTLSRPRPASYSASDGRHRESVFHLCSPGSYRPVHACRSVRARRLPAPGQPRVHRAGPRGSRARHLRSGHDQRPAGRLERRLRAAEPAGRVRSPTRCRRSWPGDCPGSKSSSATRCN